MLWAYAAVRDRRLSTDRPRSFPPGHPPNASRFQGRRPAPLSRARHTSGQLDPRAPPQVSSTRFSPPRGCPYASHPPSARPRALHAKALEQSLPFRAWFQSREVLIAFQAHPGGVLQANPLRPPTARGARIRARYTREGTPRTPQDVQIRVRRLAFRAWNAPHTPEGPLRTPSAVSPPLAVPWSLGLPLLRVGSMSGQGESFRRGSRLIPGVAGQAA